MINYITFTQSSNENLGIVFTENIQAIKKHDINDGEQTVIYLKDGDDIEIDETIHEILQQLDK